MSSLLLGAGTGGAAAVASAFVTDTFTAANATANVGRTAAVGGVVTAHPNTTGVAHIFTNRLVGQVTAGSPLDYYPVTPPSADYTVTGTFVGVTDNNSSGIAVGGRVSTSANTGVFLYYLTNGNVYEILQLVAGSATVLGSTFGASLPTSNVGSLVFAGDQVSATLDGVQIIAPATTAVLAAGVVATRPTGNNNDVIGVHLDNLSAVGA